GYPQDQSAAGLASPIKGYLAAADPVVRARSHGLFYYAGLAFDRSPDASAPGKRAIFVARYVDNNNIEAGDPIAYVGTSLVAVVSAGSDVFLDKPWMAVDVPRTGAATCRLRTSRPDGPSTQELPGGMVYVAYTRKSTDASGERWDLYLSRSSDGGVTFSTPVRISRAEDRVNQGAAIAVSPADGKVYVAWRRIDLAGDNDAILVARSLDRGRSFARASGCASRRRRQPARAAMSRTCPTRRRTRPRPP
ncbi:MAG: BNR repeat-containing protein, partial [Acidobacteriota bacterium]|nr:BNR repeat-containing protein [Acidobacteriota bacterium]